MDEAHVQHPVRLIQDGGADLVDAHRAPLHVVPQAAGGCHHDLGPLFQRVDLLADGLSTIEADHAHAGLELGQLPHLGGDLHGQLPGGGQDHGLDLVGVCIGMFNDGDAEGEGLARTGRGLGGDVLPIHHRGDASGLDGRGQLIPLLFQCAHEIRGQPQRVKAHALCDFHNYFLVLT